MIEPANGLMIPKSMPKERLDDTQIDAQALIHVIQVIDVFRVDVRIIRNANPQDTIIVTIDARLRERTGRVLQIVRDLRLRQRHSPFCRRNVLDFE